MNLFAFVSLVSSWLSLCLGSFVYAKDSKNPVNRLFLLVCFGVAYWATTEFGIRQAETFEIASLWYKLRAFWFFIAVTLFCFVLSFTEQRKWLKKQLVYLLVYIPALIFSLLHLTTNYVTGKLVKAYWGWTIVISEKTFGFYIWSIWVTSISILSIALCARYYLKSADSLKKDQAKYVLIGLVFPVVIGGLITDFLFSVLPISFPALTAPTFVIGCIFVGFAILKHQLFLEEAKRDLERRRTDFIAITSHELRTPLTSIKGYSEILEQQSDLTEEMRAKCFAAINRNVQRLERLISGVSVLNQLEHGIFRLNINNFDFCRFLTEALQPYQINLKQQLNVQGCPENNHVIIEGDADRLLQVLDNLLENAVKHTDKVNRQITVTTKIHPQVIQITVTDNGAGIAAEDLERIFNPFTSISTQYSTGGAGIGLYLARILAEAHGGTLSAQSKGKDQGTTFVLKLPRKEMAQPMSNKDQLKN